MHSSAFGAADLMALRSFSSAARFSLLKGARYSSMVCGLADMAFAPCEIKDWFSVGRSRWKSDAAEIAPRWPWPTRWPRGHAGSNKEAVDTCAVATPPLITIHPFERYKAFDYRNVVFLGRRNSETFLG